MDFDITVAIQITVNQLCDEGKEISGSTVAEIVASEFGVEQTDLLKQQCTREVRHWYLRHIAMPHSRQVLAHVGCPEPDPFTLTVASIEESDEMPFIGPSGKRPSPETQALFSEAYAIACGVLGVRATEPDLRPIWERTEDEVDSLQASYRFAGEAKIAEAEALKAEFKRRFPAAS
jgi:hypothetical protein